MVYALTLALHSILRYLVFGTLVWAVINAWASVATQGPYTKLHSQLRIWTSTLSHIQLMIGLYLYWISPIAMRFWSNADYNHIESYFFPIIHFGLMLIAIVVLTIGAAKAKRANSEATKHKIQAIWFSIALVLILIAIPWPFSPLAQRPLLRSF